MSCVSTCLSLSPKLNQANISLRKPLIRLRYPVDRYSFLGIWTERFRSTPRKFTNRGVAVVSAASIDKVGGAIKPGGLVESDKLPTDVRKRAMEAVEECGRRVTVGDVASRAGLKVTEAQKALQALAADTDGFLEVSDEGDVLYVFPRDYRSKLAAKSLRIQIEPFLGKAKVVSLCYDLLIFTLTRRMDLNLNFLSSVMCRLGCCRLFGSCFLWHGAYSVYCYRLHVNYSPAFKQKLLSARDMAQNTVIGNEQIVYSTYRDMMEQYYEGDEWDRRFKELEKSD